MTKTPFLTLVRFSLREIRFAFGHFKIFMVCLFLGAVIMTSIGSIRQNINDSLDMDAAKILGGDIQISQIGEEITPEQEEYLSQFGNISKIIVLRSMAHQVTSDKKGITGESTVINLKAVDDLYPLYGALKTNPPLDQQELFSIKDGYRGGWGR
jgi:putative ABC transport system permease protein